MIKNPTKDQLIDAGNKWLKLQFVTGRQQFKEVFTEVSANDYLTLSTLSRRMGLKESKLYLKDISKEMEMPMSQVSPRVKKLQERGLVYWKHDEDGTYITLSEIGEEAIKTQQEKLIDFINKTISIYGYEKFITLIEYREAFNDTIDQVIESYKE